MSKSNDNATVTTLVTEENPEVTVEEKQSFIQKGRTFVKNHKKLAIAATALVGLVGVAAVTGRKTAPSQETYEPSEESMEEARVALEEMNIPVSQEN